MDTINRSILSKIKSLMNSYPAVVLIGARQVGKTTILKQVLPEAKFFDLENDQDFDLTENDAALIFKDYQKPIVFDEAQLSRNLFKALRVEIDKTRENGQFLLSGSSSPELLSNISETLAGRIAIVEIPCFDLSESHAGNISKFMEAISNEKKIKKLSCTTATDEVFESCLYGGYPLPYLKRKDLDFFDSWFDNYFKTYVERDVRSLFPTLKLDSFKKFVRMLAQSSGDIINYSDFARSLDVSQPTIKKYMEIADGTFIWRTLNSYTKNSKKTVIKMPKGHFRDSGLLCFLLNIHSVEQLKSHQRFGRIWESFVVEQLLKTAKLYHSKLNYYYYRTKGGAEIDLVLEGRFGLIPIEVKSGISTTRKQLIAIKNFIKENDCPLAVIVNRGDEIKFLAEKVLQVPVNYI